VATVLAVMVYQKVPVLPRSHRKTVISKPDERGETLGAHEQSQEEAQGARERGERAKALLCKVET
jgi:hypothetical protein